MDPQTDRRKFETILREPLTRARFTLSGYIQAAQDEENPRPFTIDDFRTFALGIRGDAGYQREVFNVMEAVETGIAPQEPKFNTPETQLLWGAALAWLTLNPEAKEKWNVPAETATPLNKTFLWMQVTETRQAVEEMRSHAHHVREALRDTSIKHEWSEPGAGFTYDRKKGQINIDFMQSLIVGFEHARADVYREIGTALLSVTYPKRMQDVYRDMQPLLKRSQMAREKKAPELRPDEYKQLRLLSAEWQLRHMMFEAAEGNTANRFVDNIGQMMLQDYGVSINNTAVTSRGVGLRRLPQDDSMSDELKRYVNLVNTVQLSFFANNGMFEDTDAGWHKVGVDPNLVRRTQTLARRTQDEKNDGQGTAHPDFKHLRELAGGEKGLENLQPQPQEMMYSSFDARVRRADSARKAVIETIWREYGEDLIQRILQQVNDQVDQQLKNQQDQKKDQPKNGAPQPGGGGDPQDQQQDQDDAPQDGQPQGGGKPQRQNGQPDQKNSRQKQKGGQKGQPQEQDDGGEENGQESGEPSPDRNGRQQQQRRDGKKQQGQPQQGGEDGEGQDQGQDEGQGQGHPQKGQPQQGKGQKGKGQQGGQQGEGEAGGEDPFDQEGSDGQQQNGRKGGKGANGNSGGDGGKDNGRQQPGQEGSDQQNGEENGQEGGKKGNRKSAVDKLGTEKDSTVPVEGAGNMPAADKGFEKPADEMSPDGASGDDNGQDGEGQGKTLEELERDLQDMEEQAQDKGAKGGPGDGSEPGDEPGDQKGKAGHGDGKLADYGKRSWQEYQTRVTELAPHIARTRKLFRALQKKQQQPKRAMSRKLEVLPENGEVAERFNIEAHSKGIIDRHTGQTEGPAKRFHKDEVQQVPTEIDVVIAIDGSASMTPPPEPAAIHSALQFAAILYEAADAKDLNINVYVMMWGDKDPKVLIRPGDDKVKVGNEMERAHKGLNSGTDLAPAIAKVAQVIGEKRGSSGTLSGFTHVIVVSDGDLYGEDVDRSKRNIANMFKHTNKVTFDVAIIGKPDTNMEGMARDMNRVAGRKPGQQVGVAVGADPEQVPFALVGLVLDKINRSGSFTAIPHAKKQRDMRRAHAKMEVKP